MTAPRKAIPGPRGYPVLGSIPEIAPAPLEFFRRIGRAHGDVAAFNLPGERPVVLSHPEGVEYVLVTANRDFVKSLDYRKGLSLLGNGLLTSDGDFWLRQRRLMQPAFHREKISGYASVMVEFARRRAQGWKPGQSLDLHDEMMALTLEIVVKCLFDAEAGEATKQVGHALEVLLKTFDLRMRNPLYRFLSAGAPLPQNLRLARTERWIDGVIGRIVADHRSKGEGGDLLSTLIAARDEDGSAMTDKQLRDEVMTLFLAGHETTANLLSWTFWLLSQHPEAEEQLRAEAASALGGRPATAADVPRLPFTERVVKEVLRLYPPAWGISREALKAFEVGGHTVPKGTRVIVMPWITQRDPRWWDRPDHFAPERWADGLEKRLPRFAYWPFGGGPRLCIGQSFAQMEAVLVLATLVQHARFTVQPGYVPKPYASATLRPKHGLPVTIKPL